MTDTRAHSQSENVKPTYGERYQLRDFIGNLREYGIHNDYVENKSTSVDPAHLSHYIFKDPVDFLTALKSIKRVGPRTSPGDTGGLSEQDYLQYSRTTNDERTKAAAQIAVTHFTELRELSNTSLEGYWPDFSISQKDIDKDIHLITGKAQHELHKEQWALGIAAGMSGLEALGMGVLAAASIETVGFAAVAGVGALAAGGTGAYKINEISRLPSFYELKGRKDLSIVSSWDGVGKRKAQ